MTVAPQPRGSHTGQYHLHLMEGKLKKKTPNGSSSFCLDYKMSGVQHPRLSAIKPPHLVPAVLASCSHLPPLPLLHCPPAALAAAWCHVDNLDPLHKVLLQDDLTVSTSFRVVFSRLLLLWLFTSILRQSFSPVI